MKKKDTGLNITTPITKYLDTILILEDVMAEKNLKRPKEK
nr:MAG TPA: hypothetical protein [Bacteriophage sp.]